GVVFVDVESDNTTSIEYFNGATSLGKFFVPKGASAQPEFLGELFSTPVITRIQITVGTAQIFSLGGTTVTPGPADITNDAGGADLAVTDDFIYAEPAALPLATAATVTATEGAAFTGPVASFTDLDPAGTAADFTATITWGDGHDSSGTVAANSAGGFTVSG